MQTTAAITAALVLTATGHAQTASYTTFGTGCGGSTGSPCISVNWNKRLNTNQGGANYAFQLSHPVIPRLLCGAEFYMRASVSAAPITVSLIAADNFNRPTTTLTSAVMRVETTLQTYRVVFPKQVLLKAQTTYFLGFVSTARLMIPHDPKGSNILYFRNGPNWQGPYPGAWSYRLLCCGGGRVPALTPNGLPKIGHNFGIDVSNAPADTNVLLTFGVQRTALDLTPAGAPGCTLFTQPLALAPLRTNASGSQTFWAYVPNDAKLIGAGFVNQLAVPHATANSLKMIFSNGGAARIGK